MSDSHDTDGQTPPWHDDMFAALPDSSSASDEAEAAPSKADLEAAGQFSMFGEPAPMPAEVPASTPKKSPEPVAEEATPAEALEPPVAVPAPQEAPVAVSAEKVEPSVLPEAEPDLDEAENLPAQAPVVKRPPQEAATKAPEALPDKAAQPYRVLARKYRPQTFAELIGQEAMVRTLANAIKRDRLAHAFLMTGVRGVGKTSTARLIAKALNCIGPDGQGGPTIDPCGVCEPCRAIAEGRHIDVIEMDAASHTGVDDVREIIEAVRYAAVSARYKIYIIDEVHMLSRNAFNALLKTLEEPPAHVKFLFATTEVDKLPVTVLSRCQRFDLRRIPSAMLAEHFGKICELEGVEAEGEALAMVAAAAEGSVRDGLSILDQAIAHADLDGEGKVQAVRVRDMLGLSDKSTQRRLVGALLDGDGTGVLEVVTHQYSLGVEPVSILRGLMELTHRIAVAQVSGNAADAPSNEEREAIEGWAKALRAGQVHRLWQLLIKGHDEVKSAPDPLVAAQMALLRIMHAADMPDPGSLVRKLEEIASRAPAPVAATANDAAPGGAAMTAPQGKGQNPGAVVTQWEALVDDVEHIGEMSTANTMRMQVRVVELAPALLRYAQPPGFNEDIAALMRNALGKVTGERWQVERVTGEEGVPTLVEQAEGRKAEAGAALVAHPLVQATLAAFPEAEMIEDERPAAIGGGRRQWRR
ncbi:DNA polymerase III subunit gamma/tau [Novosphingobium sp. 9]|uniref:DNA polymerase III subunit gamma/tau n=1 Tax=Novosphingobium sp. 9 TaxID=2025349 RepID=UPI0021B581FD|nr:DNA polymerase III subunit gamma/tau [Novosphingobium sp. 9]